MSIIGHRQSPRCILWSLSRLTHVSVPKDGNLVIEHSKLDVAVSLLMDGIQRPNLILAGIPVHLQVLLFILLAEDLVEIYYDLFICAALEWNGFALVVETCTASRLERQGISLNKTHLDPETE